jgi:predicted AlkP superfamily phosphohydrolase/phosphomutase
LSWQVLLIGLQVFIRVFQAKRKADFMQRVLAIGIDGSEPSLVMKWAQDGSMPNMKRLMAAGEYGPMESFAGHLPGSNWFSFFLGEQPGAHGLYSYLSWRPEKMEAVLPSPKWINVTSFWHHLKEGGPRGIILNVPDAFMLRKFNGVELLALANDHALTHMISHPRHVAADVRKQFGRFSFPEENYDLMSFREFLTTRDEMIAQAFKLRDVYLKMIRDESWDFFLAVFPILHRAGHRLWSTTNIHDLDLHTEQQKAEASDALRQVYMAFDKVLGELMDAAATPVLTLLFSFYGMFENHSRETILPEMLRRVLESENKNIVGQKPVSETKAKSLLVTIRNAIPNSWRHKVKSKLPYSWRYKLISFWRLGQLDWSKVRAFVIPLEVRIGIRINLKGRERLGIVQPGKEYDDLCQKIMADLATFVDADTGNPLVKNLEFSKDVFDGERVDWLPDIVGSWNDTPSANHRVITSPVYGDIPWPTPGKNPEGRSGNHTSSGFLIAHGDEIRPGSLKDAHILDLAPTILHLLGESIPAGLEGKILRLIKE